MTKILGMDSDDSHALLDEYPDRRTFQEGRDPWVDGIDGFFSDDADVLELGIEEVEACVNWSVDGIVISWVLSYAKNGWDNLPRAFCLIFISVITGRTVISLTKTLINKVSSYDTLSKSRAGRAARSSS